MLLIDDQARYCTAEELEIIARHLPLAGAEVLELGCGRAWMTRKLAERFHPARVIATEVDPIQHEKNCQITDLSEVEFRYGGAESIDLPDRSIDCVLMLKSLHHVPVTAMDQALQEVARVLRPGGIAYISEPVYRGEFNAIMSLFHDEQQVRQAAFAAIERAVASGLLQLQQQVFFNAPGHFADFADFEQRMLNVTHTEHRIDAPLYARIKAAFEQHMGEDGAHFLKPSRVDLLRRPI